MKFEITRASDNLGEKAPVPEAVKEGSEWHIELGTLDDLLALSDRVGQLIVNRQSIWIYDDYME